jgi:amino acid transporter
MGVAMASAAVLLDFEAVVTVTSLGILSYYALINLAAIRLRKQGDIPRLVTSYPFSASSPVLAWFSTRSSRHSFDAIVIPSR